MKAPLSQLVALLIAAALFLVGCTVELPPIASASVSRYASGSAHLATQLSPEGRAAVALWFANHKTGWSRSYVSYAPSVELRLVQQSGEAIVVNLMPGKVVVYGSFGQYEQRFEPSALAALVAAVGENGG